MKKLLVQFASYNLWANQRYVDAISNLSEEQLHKDLMTGSFKSIYATFIHMWDAESIWWQRLKLTENAEHPSLKFTGSVLELGSLLIQQSRHWKEWVDIATETALEHEFIYKNSKKDQFKQPVYEMILHLFNHQSYHRGQLLLMLREVGVKDALNTDLISFLRKK